MAHIRGGGSKAQSLLFEHCRAVFVKGTFLFAIPHTEAILAATVFRSCKATLLA